LDFLSIGDLVTNARRSLAAWTNSARGSRCSRPSAEASRWTAVPG